MATTEYRRRKGSDEEHPWHFCTNCRSWPGSNFDRTTARPGSVCHECESLERRQMCIRPSSTVL